jgi:hypothetical protein
MSALPLFRPLSALSSRAVEWLWPGHLPLGKLAILEGDPGLGKSLAALDLCARLSRGRPWPDGSPSPGPGASVFLDGEDDEEDTVKPRLLALGADTDRVFAPDRRDDELAVPLSLPSQIAALDRAVEQAQARLVVIDPVTAFFDAGVNLLVDASVRRALAPLAALARRHACAVVLVRHLNKTSGAPAIYRGLASIGLVSVCRTAWLVAEAAPGSRRRVLAQVKNNLAAPQPSLAFEVTQPDGGAVALDWLGPVEATADGLLGQARRRGRVPLALPTATAFLEDLLADGPRPAHEVWERARAEGISEMTLKRAKKELEVRSQWLKVDGRPVRYWRLKLYFFPPEGGPGVVLHEGDPQLDELRRQYPSQTPLDDDD